MHSILIETLSRLDKMRAAVTLFLITFLFAFSPPQSGNTRLNEKVVEARAYCKANALNQKIAVLIDMQIHSGKNRIFVVDLATGKPLQSGLVAHGCCDNLWGEDETASNPTFSNKDGSHCSSLGKYKIGKRGYSNWGINVNYKLHGLEATNKNAYSRLIVLHSWDMVADEETFPTGTPEGWGCPAVSDNYLTELDKRLQKESGNVLMWIYN